MAAPPHASGTNGFKAAITVTMPARDGYAETGRVNRGRRFIELLAGLEIDVTGRCVSALGTGCDSAPDVAAEHRAMVAAVGVDRLSRHRDPARQSRVSLSTISANLLDRPGMAWP
jgi:hypothetical protein